MQEKTDLVFKMKMKDGKPDLNKDGKPQPDGAAIGVKLADGKVYKGWKTSTLKINIFSKKWEDACPGQASCPAPGPPAGAPAIRTPAPAPTVTITKA